jgi:hypothetical protein
LITLTCVPVFLNDTFDLIHTHKVKLSLCLTNKHYAMMVCGDWMYISTFS